MLKFLVSAKSKYQYLLLRLFKEALRDRPKLSQERPSLTCWLVQMLALRYFAATVAFILVNLCSFHARTRS